MGQKHSRKKRFRQDIRQFRKQVMLFTIALFLLLLANSAFSNHASIKSAIKPTIARFTPKLFQIIEQPVGEISTPEPTSPSLLALGGAMLLWSRRRKQASTQVMGFQPKSRSHE